MLPGMKIASPCSADWNRMTGDDRIRHCSECNLDVHNLAAMTEREVLRLIVASRGQRLCARLYRRADGTILTKDCPVGFRAKVLRVSRRIGVVLSGALSVGFAYAQAPSPQNSSLVQIDQAQNAIDVVIVDETGAVVLGAKIVVESGNTKIAEGVTDSRGRFAMSVPPGNYTITASAHGFRETSVKTTAPQRQRLPIELKLGASENMGVVVIAENGGLQPEISTVDQLLPPPADSEAPAESSQDETHSRSQHFLSRLAHKLGF
jgi:hypothetical protein